MKKILKLLMISFIFSLPFTLCVQAAQKTAVGEEAAKSSSSSIQPYASEELVNIDVEGTENYDYAWEVLDLVNEEREKEGVGPLTMDQELMDAPCRRNSVVFQSYPARRHYLLDRLRQSFRRKYCCKLQSRVCYGGLDEFFRTSL